MNVEQNQNHFRFSLPMMLALMLGFCFVSVFARQFSSALVLVIPPVVGPFVAYSRVPTWQASMIGLFSAYFWCFVLVIPAIAPWLATYYNVPVFTAVLPCLAGSFLGGWIGAEVDRGRLKQRRSRELREARSREVDAE